MKLFRSDLITGFKNKLFETELKKIDNENIALDNNKLICELFGIKKMNIGKDKINIIKEFSSRDLILFLSAFIPLTQ